MECLDTYLLPYRRLSVPCPLGGVTTLSKPSLKGIVSAEMVCLKVDENLPLLLFPVLREEASRLFLGQAGYPTLGVAVTFRDALARLPKRRGSRPRPRPGVGGSRFQHRNRRNRAGAASWAPPTLSYGPFIGWVCGDVVGFTDSTLSARRAGGIVLHPSFVQSSAHLALGASWRCNPERVPAAAAAAAAMVSPVTVVSARAREPASPRPSPQGLGTGQRQARPSRGAEEAAVPSGKRRLSRSSAPHFRSAPPPRAPLSTRGREENIVHVTRKRDSVDP